jgi:hypothetical protein
VTHSLAGLMASEACPACSRNGQTIGFRETYSSEWTPDFTHEFVQNDLGRKFRGLFAGRSYALETYQRLLRERGITPHIGLHGVADGSGLGTIRWVGEAARPTFRRGGRCGSRRSTAAPPPPRRHCGS